LAAQARDGDLVIDVLHENERVFVWAREARRPTEMKRMFTGGQWRQHGVKAVGGCAGVMLNAA
jgi:hypothetical protein